MLWIGVSGLCLCNVRFTYDGVWCIHAIWEKNSHRSASIQSSLSIHLFDIRYTPSYVQTYYVILMQNIFAQEIETSTKKKWSNIEKEKQNTNRIDKQYKIGIDMEQF